MAKAVLRNSYTVRDRSRYQLDVSDDVMPSMTRQEFADEADINVLMKRYEKGGSWPPNPIRQPEYFDVDNVPTDFHTVMNQVIAAEELFMQLPAQARFSLGNDPARFVAFASDPENIDQLREWGLAEPKAPAPAPLDVRVVPDPEAPAPAPKAS